MDEKVVFVTGGATGLGRSIVDKFVTDNHKVVFTYFKSEEKAQNIINKYGDKVYGIKTDAIDYEEVLKSIEQAINKYGRIDILVNNVAAAKDAPIGDHTPETWDYTIKNTLYSCFNYINAITSHFVKNRYGKIINIGSVNGLRGREGSVAYSTAKAGMVGLTKTVAKELGRYNINVNLIAPGYIDTEAQKSTSMVIKKLVLDECIIKELTKPDEISELVLFLASDKANAITGQVYKIDRGQYV